jgi:hypothetical protein
MRPIPHEFCSPASSGLARDFHKRLDVFAHEYRLAIYRLLVEQEPGGLLVGVIGDALGLVFFSPALHLLVAARGRITQLRASHQFLSRGLVS